MATTGWARLGAAFGGGDTREAEQDAMLGTARVESALIDARKKRDELNAIEQLETDLADVVGEEMARPFATMLRAGKNPEQVTDARLDNQRYDATASAQEAAQGGNLDLMNALLSVASGDPMVQNKVEGNTIISPYTQDARARTTDYGSRYLDNQAARAAARAPSTAERARRDPRAALNETMSKEIVARYGKLMAREGADVPALMLQRDKELAQIGMGPHVAEGTEPAVADMIGALNNLPSNATPEQERDAARSSGVEVEQVEARKTYRGKMYVKINGTWYEE